MRPHGTVQKRPDAPIPFPVRPRSPGRGVLVLVAPWRDPGQNVAGMAFRLTSLPHDGVWHGRAERPPVLAALERCRSGHNAGRVHRAILALSFRSVLEVERLVEIANRSLKDLTRLAGVDWTR